MKWTVWSRSSTPVGALEQMAAVMKSVSVCVCVGLYEETSSELPVNVDT